MTSPCRRFEKGKEGQWRAPSPSAYRYRNKILMPPELQKQCAEKRVLAQIICKLRKHGNLVEMDAPPNDNATSDAAPESGRNVRGKSE